ncbi:MAG TPA: hypothetical protein VGC13_11500 [Longimicrobium sp.]|uniref:hypothetical protein n=1 Tax=Longimicrobium sp. TaxID=2029185 RepID=UPI002ED8ED92
MRRTVLMLGVLALAACGAPPEPESGPAPAGQRPVVLDVGGGGTPSIRGLIGERQRLRLTGAQVTTLDSIAMRLASANDSLRNSIGAAGERPRPGSAEWQRTIPVLETMARNNRAAGLLVQEVLTEEQRRIACEMQAEDEGPEPMRRTPPGAARIGGRGRPAEVVEPRARGWPWCAAPVPAAPR